MERRKVQERIEALQAAFARLDRKPDGCGACSNLCPQGIDIPAAMKALHAALAQE